MPDEKRPLKVFLCHASQDKPVVRELNLRLKAEGWIETWLDERKLLPGQDWRLSIEEAVETSDIVIICLSNNSVSKEGFVQKELRYAREIALEKPEETIFLIPLRLNECDVPRGLRFYQWANYFGEEKDETYSILLQSLNLRHEQKLKTYTEDCARKERVKQEREAAERNAHEKEERERDAAEKEKLARIALAQFKEQRRKSRETIHNSIKTTSTKTHRMPYAKIFIALAILVTTVIVSYISYDMYVVPNQYEINYQNARNAAIQTLKQQNVAEQRKGWADTLAFLDAAEQSKVTPDSQALRIQAQGALDVLDRVLRVNYQRAFSSILSPALRVTHMAASDTEIYLLDDAKGNVVRGSMNGYVYDLDPTFKCDPGTYNGLLVSRLVDILTLPRANPLGATLLGIDADGNLLYCIPDQEPQAVMLQMPDVGWKQITAIAFDSNNLYVLDAPGRAVWVYFGGQDIVFAGKAPYYFFEEEIPNSIEQAIGIAVNGDDLYLLHQDGHLTTCTFSRIDTSPTRCTDAALFIDTRSGYPSGSTLVDGIFTQITFTSPPTPALALLQPRTQTVFRFVAHPQELELQKQIRATAGKANPLPAGEVTAMAYGPNKTLFIFVGGQVYFAENVPAE